MIDTHVCAYWLGRCEAITEGIESGDIVGVPGIFVESLRGQRDHWRQLLHENGQDYTAWRGKRQHPGGKVVD